MKLNKKAFFLIPLFISFSIAGLANNFQSNQFRIDTIPLTDNSELKVFEKVEIEAKFPGGDNYWRRFLEQNLNAAVPVDNGAPAGIYTVVIQFVVDKDGNITNITPLSHHGFGMEKEVMRAIAKGPKWVPAVQDGRFVKAFRKQPVTFQVIEERRKNKKNKD